MAFRKFWVRCFWVPVSGETVQGSVVENSTECLPGSQCLLPHSRMTKISEPSEESPALRNGSLVIITLVSPQHWLAIESPDSGEVGLDFGYILFPDCVTQDPCQGWSWVLFCFPPLQKDSKSICHIKHTKPHKVSTNEIIVSSQADSLSWPWLISTLQGLVRQGNRFTQGRDLLNFHFLRLHQTLGVWGLWD